MGRFKINNSNGWTEVILLNNCEMQKVVHVAAIMTEKLGIQFTQEVNNMDFLYWDFNFKGAELCLHYSIYIGISLFPLRFEQAEDWENEVVLELAHEIESSGLFF